jgi:phage repressor protein C with HTH and peptisase S24 domain/DNA-binding XRE family transcriptional regulator
MTEALIRLRERAGLSLEGLAKAAGTTRQQLFKLEKGDRKLTKEWAERLAPHLNASWIEVMGGQIYRVPHHGRDTSKLEHPYSSDLDNADRPGDGIEYQGRAYTPLPVYDVMVSAGPGSFNGDHDEPEGWSLLSLDQVRSVTRAPIDQLALVRVSGDSMTPTLMNNDQILVDRSIRRVGRDGMYVIAMGDEVQVKRISRNLASKTLTVASDNEIYPTSQGVPEDGVTVLGRVVWISRNVGG